jgi:hypothetical protein
MRLNCESLPLDEEVQSLEDHLTQSVQASPSTSASESEQVPFDPAIFEKLLQHECRLWQHKLRLQDWNVKVVLCRLNEMPDNDAIGYIKPVLERKDAYMLLLSPMDTPLLAAKFLNDEEVNYGLTIVHELLHLHLWPFTQRLNEAETVAEEQAINALSRCIVSAYSSKIKPLVSPSTTASTGHYL